MILFRISSSSLPTASLGLLCLVSTLWLAACAPNRTEVASNEPSVCGGDFGMIEQMQYEYRGNAKPAGPEAYVKC